MLIYLFVFVLFRATLEKARVTVCGSVYLDTNAPPHVVLMGKKQNDTGRQDPRKAKTEAFIPDADNCRL